MCSKLIIVSLLLAVFSSSLCDRRTVLGSPSSLVFDAGIEPCDDNSDCVDWTNATCIDNFCNCNGTKNCPKISEELKINKIGRNCSSDKACNIEFSTCHEGKCTCPSDRVTSIDERRCLLIAKGLQDKCEESVQCRIKEPNSECKNNKCVCQEQLHEVKGVCYKDVGLQEPCNVTEECSKTRFSTCNVNKCVCKDRYIPSKANNQCLLIANRIDDDCNEDVQCSKPFGAAGCKNGHCKCQELYDFKWTSQTCVRDKLLGDTCVVDLDCFEPNTDSNERLECIIGECKCRSSYEEVNGYCVISSAKMIKLPHIVHLVLGIVFFLLCEY